jgi:hypothetical protein
MALRQNSFNRPRSLSDDLGDESEILPPRPSCRRNPRATPE